MPAITVDDVTVLPRITEPDPSVARQRAVRSITKVGGPVVSDFRYDGNGNQTQGDGRTITYTPFNGVVAQKALTVTATGPSKIYGTALSAGPSAVNFTAGATGVGSETVTSVTLTPNAAGLSATTAAGTSSRFWRRAPTE